MLFCMFVGAAWAQTATTYANGVYKIYWQADQRGYLVYHGTDYPNSPQLAGVVNHNPNGHYALNAEGLNFGWYLYTSQKTNKSYLFEATTGKFITIDLNTTVGNGKACVLSENVSVNAQLDLLEGSLEGNKDYTDQYLFRYTVGSTNYHFCSGCGSNKGDNPVRFSTDGQGDGGNRFVFKTEEGVTIADEVKNAAIAKITEFENKVVDVKYVFTYGGQTRYEQTASGVVGEEYPAINSANFAFGIVASKPEGNILETDVVDGVVTKEIALTVSLPFVPASDYASIENWYYVKIKGASYLSHDASKTYIDLSNKSSVDVNNKDAYTWAFVGNPFDGFQLVNKVTGEGWVLSSSTTIDGDGANTHPVMKETPVGESFNTYWMLTKSGYQTNGFFMAQKGFASNRMNDRGSKLAYWTGGADNGSTFTVEKRNFIQHEIIYQYVYNEEVKHSETMTVEGDAEFPACSYAAPYGVTVGEKPSGVVTANGTHKIQLTVSKELPFKTAADVNSIDTWYYARMHTNQPGYIGDIADDKTVNVEWGKSSDEYNENYLWGFSGNIWDGITVVNKGTGLQLTSTGGGNATLTETGTPFFVARTTETSANATNGFCLRKKDSNQYLNANYGAAKLSHWDSTDAGSTFFLTEYNETDVTVTAADYATLFLGHSAYIPAGVEVYAVTEVANGYVKMELVEGVLPANSGVILKNEGSYTFKTAAKDAAAIEGNLLLGTVENTYVEGLAYVLGKDGDEVGLFKAALNKDADGNVGTTHFLNNANKAYLPASAVTTLAATLRFNFGGNTTAIESVLNNGVDANAPIYDLSGRRVMNAVKGGIYIQNGKKFIVK